MGLAAYGRAASIEPWPVFDVAADSFNPPFSLPDTAIDRQRLLAWWDHFRSHRTAGGELHRGAAKMPAKGAMT